MSLFAQFMAKPESFYEDEEAQPDWMEADTDAFGDSDDEIASDFDNDTAELEAEDVELDDVEVAPTAYVHLLCIFAYPDANGKWEFYTPDYDDDEHEMPMIQVINKYCMPTARGVVSAIFKEHGHELPAAFGGTDNYRVYFKQDKYMQCGRTDTTTGEGTGTLGLLDPAVFIKPLDALRTHVINDYKSVTDFNQKWDRKFYFYSKEIDSDHHIIPVFVTPGDVALPNLFGRHTWHGVAFNVPPFYSLYAMQMDLVDLDMLINAKGELWFPPLGPFKKLAFNMPMILFADDNDH